MKLTAIVPVWNGRELLERLLTTVAAQTCAADELLVVDNGSTDGAPDVARAHGARVIAMGRNAGFAAAVNRGIGEAQGQWIAVLNSDVELAPDYFARLLEADAWLATGKILAAGTSDQIDGTFDAVCRGAAAWRAGSGRPDGPLFAKSRRITSPPWTAVLFRAELFERVGRLEESFESYLEDVDFGLRCAAQGINGMYVPQAVAWHRGNAALGRWNPETVRLISRNQVLLVARHYSRQVLLHCMWPILVAQLLWGGVALRHGAGWGWLRGKLQGLRAFRSARGPIPTFDPGLLQHLLISELQIRDLQASLGFDPYWKLYFRLTGSGAK